MSQRAIKWAGKVSGVQKAERSVLLVLCAMANGQGQLAKTVQQIAAFAGVSDRTIQRGIASLEERGLLVREFRRGAKGRQAACLITLQLGVLQGDKIVPANDVSRVSDCHPGRPQNPAVPRVREYNYSRAGWFISPPYSPPQPFELANQDGGEITPGAENVFVLASYRDRVRSKAVCRSQRGGDNLIGLVGGIGR